MLWHIKGHDKFLKYALCVLKGNVTGNIRLLVGGVFFCIIINSINYNIILL